MLLFKDLARLAKLDYVEQTKRDQELHAKIAAERAEAKYARHYEMCAEILSEIVDVSCKVSHLLLYLQSCCLNDLFLNNLNINK